MPSNQLVSLIIQLVRAQKSGDRARAAQIRQQLVAARFLVVIG